VGVWASANPPRPSRAVGTAAPNITSTTTPQVPIETSPTTTTSVTTIATTPPTTESSTVPRTVPTLPDGPATYINHGPADVNSVALTFHLGGSPALVSKLLDALKANNIRSTLFAIGDWLTANAELGHRAVDDGHELGNHTKSHKSMLKLSSAQVHDEIVGGGEALVPFIGSIGKWFRPSGTDVPNDIILQQAGLAGYPVSVGYDVDSLDYTNPGAKAVITKITNELHAGAIVSLHFGHQNTIDAFPKIVDLVAAAGLTPVTVSGLLGGT
jgi:peptidoglycan/xylan/chitin deacetylase (PgdA/CDA1 family)